MIFITSQTFCSVFRALARRRISRMHMRQQWLKIRRINQHTKYVFWGFVKPSPINPQILKILRYKSRFSLKTHIKLSRSATQIRSRIGNSHGNFKFWLKTWIGNALKIPKMVQNVAKWKIHSLYETRHGKINFRANF